MSVPITLWGKDTFQLLYASAGYVAELTVTGYLILPDLTKSVVVAFEELGDGIYTGLMPFTKVRNRRKERLGLVIKEDGVVKKFEIIDLETW